MADSLNRRYHDKGLPTHDVVARQLFDGSFPLPTAILLESAVRHNIDVMSTLCSAREVLLAPHAKTTMSPELVRRQLAAGAWAMTAATAWQTARIAEMGAGRIVLANQLVDQGSLRVVDDLFADYPDLELYCYVDSLIGLSLLERHTAAGRLHVLVELGIAGGRTGVRTDADAEDLARRVAAGPLSLAGFAAFEGILSAGSVAATLPLVDELLDRLSGIALRAWSAGLIVTERPIVTVGGSTYFDRVIDHLAPALRDSAYAVVLRSGCYVTHDCGTYAAQTPSGTRLAAMTPLRNAIEIWAAVLSTPEPGRVIVGLGRRDASFDAGLPVPLWRVRNGTRTAADQQWRVVALNDQHAYLDVAPDADLVVGDLVGFGISHPCTTFDKWSALPLVDDDYTVVELVTTRF